MVYPCLSFSLSPSSSSSSSSFPSSSLAFSFLVTSMLAGHRGSARDFPGVFQDAATWGPGTWGWEAVWTWGIPKFDGWSWFSPTQKQSYMIHLFSPMNTPCDTPLQRPRLSGVAERKCLGAFRRDEGPRIFHFTPMGRCEASRHLDH